MAPLVERRIEVGNRQATTGVASESRVEVGAQVQALAERCCSALGSSWFLVGSAR